VRADVGARDDPREFFPVIDDQLTRALLEVDYLPVGRARSNLTGKGKLERGPAVDPELPDS
jgi:hypothetical protein